MIRQSWEKYSLIVVGNIVFFALLYFISYRPNNDENRAAELLSTAQEQETIGLNEAAMVLYRKVETDYPDTRAAETAKERLPSVTRRLATTPRQEPELIPPRLDLSEMLDRKPAIYVAAFLARHYGEDPSQKEKIREKIKQYLQIATITEGATFESLRQEKEFQGDTVRREFFTVQPRCNMIADWLYDDFQVVNTNFFPWTNVNIKVAVSQSDDSEEMEIRLPRVEPGEAVDVLEFWVSGSGGVVTCKGELTAQEGATSWTDRI